MTDPLQAPSILLVEESDEQAFALMSALEVAGHRTRRARSADEALDLLQKELPDVAIVSLSHAGDGCAACGQLAEARDAFEASARRSFAVLCIGDNDAAAKAAFAAGADDVVGTIADFELLGLRLRAITRRRAARGETLRLADDRQSAEQAAQQFRMLVQGVVDYAIYLLDPHGRVSTWNAGAERIKGYSAEEIIGREFSIFYTEADRASHEPERALLTARLHGRYETEAARVRKNGEEFWAHVVIDPIHGNDGEIVGYAKITRDVTERRKAQEELHETRTALMQAQKMEAIGQLTGGIAHDFNNMLAGIIGALSLLQRRITAERYGDALRLIDAALTSANRAASLTSRLLAFGRRQSLDIRSIDVNATIASMRLLLERSLGENVELRMMFGAETLSAETDVNHLESAILNLVINARDAMPDGGVLTIETKREAIIDDEDELATGEYALIRVSDTGMGMSAEVLEKVFDPFFTTKPIGQGTGLGLSMVYGFARQSKGRVRIASAPGKGTNVNLSLPAARTLDDAKADETPGAEVGGDGECVLIVEDDAQVRMLVRETLNDLGYRTVEAENAQQALEILCSARPLDLVVSDVGLPGMDGRQLADLARELRPRLNVLLMTGYAQHAGVRSKFLGPGMEMILKPFTLETLGRKVRELIGQAAAGRG